MKKALAIAASALALSGCSSYHEIARWESAKPLENGEVPVATFLTQNISYQFLGMPFCTGRPWTEGTEEIVDEHNVKWFSDEATIDGNLQSLKHALALVGSDRITKLETFEDDHAAWSLFLFNRHEVRTKCIILPSEPPADASADTSAEAAGK